MALLDPCLPVIFQNGYLAGKLTMLSKTQSRVETDWLRPDKLLCLTAMSGHSLNKHTLRANFFTTLRTLARGLGG